MNDAVIAAEPAVSTPVVETPAPPVVEEITSIAEHQEAYGQPGRERAEPGETAQERADRDERGRFRHRAQSQKASADDVPTINQLTRDLREKEQELIKAKPEAGNESPRVRALRRQIKAIESELSEGKASAPVVAEPSKPVVPYYVKAMDKALSSFGKAKPTIESLQAAGDPDPYGNIAEALMDWREEKRQFEADTQLRGQRDAESRQQQEQMAARYNDNLAKFRASHADFDTVTKAAGNMATSPVMEHAILTSDRGAEFVYTLAQQPDLLDELFLQTAQTPVTPEAVASMQRRLAKHAQAANTGSVAVPRRTYTPPPPPNPVRTGPLTTNDEPPAEASSISEHAKYHGQKRR